MFKSNLSEEIQSKAVTFGNEETSTVHQLSRVIITTETGGVLENFFTPIPLSPDGDLDEEFQSELGDWLEGRSGISLSVCEAVEVDYPEVILRLTDTIKLLGSKMGMNARIEAVPILGLLFESDFQYVRSASVGKEISFDPNPFRTQITAIEAYRREMRTTL